MLRLARGPLHRPFLLVAVTTWVVAIFVVPVSISAAIDRLVVLGSLSAMAELVALLMPVVVVVGVDLCQPIQISGKIPLNAP